MIEWRNLIPKWVGDIVEPPESKKEEGYHPGDKPPAKWENWFRNAIYKVLGEHREKIEEIDAKAGDKSDIIAVEDDLANHKTTSDAHLAENIKLVDSVFTASNVEGGMSELFTNVSNGKDTIATAITDKGEPASGDLTFLQLANKIREIETQSILTGNALTSQVLSGQTFYSDNPDNKLTGTMPDRGSKTYTPSDSTQTGASGYYSGITVNPRPSLTGTAATGDVLSGKSFYGNSYLRRSGTMPNRGSVTNTITTQGGQYTIPSGYHSGVGKVTASFSNLSAGNIKDGVSIGGVRGNYRGPTLSGEFIEVGRENFSLNKNSTATFDVSPDILNYYVLYVEAYYLNPTGSNYMHIRTYANTYYRTIKKDSNAPLLSLSGNTFTITAALEGRHGIGVYYYR